MTGYFDLLAGLRLLCPIYRSFSHKLWAFKLFKLNVGGQYLGQVNKSDSWPVIHVRSQNHRTKLSSLTGSAVWRRDSRWVIVSLTAVAKYALNDVKMSIKRLYFIFWIFGISEISFRGKAVSATREIRVLKLFEFYNRYYGEAFQGFSQKRGFVGHLRAVRGRLHFLTR